MSPKNRIMNNNYHTHMYLCRHAIGDVNDYVEEAIRLGFKSLGMSDHAPFEELKDRSVRMYPSDFPIYLDKCNSAKEKYKEHIKFYTGLEIEYFTEHKNIYPKLLSQIDYLALGQHYIYDPLSNNNLRSSYGLVTKEHMTKYVDTIEEALKSGHFKFICHPDLFLFNVIDFDQVAQELSTRLIELSVKYNTPLEINANGIRKGLIQTSSGPRYKYPREEFWMIAKKLKARVIVSSDAHSPQNLYDDVVNQTIEFASTLGITVEEELEI